MVSCPQFLKYLLSYKSEMGMLLFITSSFPPQLSLCQWVTFGQHLRLGVGCYGNKPWVEDREFSVPFPTSQERERGWSLNQSPMAKDLINHALVMKLPQKPKGKGFRELSGWWTRTLPGTTILGLKLHRNRSSLVQYLSLCISSSGY